MTFDFCSPPTILFDNLLGGRGMCGPLLSELLLLLSEEELVSGKLVVPWAQYTDMDAVD